MDEYIAKGTDQRPVEEVRGLGCSYDWALAGKEGWERRGQCMQQCVRVLGKQRWACSSSF